MMFRRRFGLALGAALATRAARAESRFPDRPIRVIVPFGAGSAADVAIRLTAPRMGQLLGEPLVVEDKAGATGAIGSNEIARAAPDGYSLVLGTVASHATLAATASHLPYDILRDFTPIGLLTNSWLIMVVNPAVPAKTIAEFVAWSKQSPAPINYASGGIGGVTNLAAELLRIQTGANLNHIPYRDAAEGITDTMAGHVQMMIYPSAVIPLIRAEQLRALAVFAPKRLPALPDVPTAVEQGYPDLIASGWQALFGPAHLPDPVRDTLAAAMRNAVADKDVSAALIAQGFDPDPESTPEKLGSFVAGEIAKWKQVVQAPGVQVR